MKNFTLKQPKKLYIWSVKSTNDVSRIMLTEKLNPNTLDFWYQVGQFIDGKIIEMKLIGYKLIKDYYNNDVEEIFKNTGKFMKQENIIYHNEGK